MSDLFDNPMGTDGFEFVEYRAPDPGLLRSLFGKMGFPATGRHRSKNVTRHSQLQIFTQNVIGPIFFEIVQRKGNEGFGEGNFQALFESIELDQMRRGVLEEG